jgi:hypothetical protein
MQAAQMLINNMQRQQQDQQMQYQQQMNFIQSRRSTHTTCYQMGDTTSCNSNSY